jgi:catecholate siderophore receptor
VDTPRTITVISRQVLDDTNSASLAEALRTVPGIALGAGEGGNPLGDRPFIRGTDSSNSMYLDGVRDMSAQSREVFAVDLIEVTKGSDGVMNGGGNGGGSINLVSKTPQARPFARGDVSYGSADYKRITGDINLPLSDNGRCAWPPCTMIRISPGATPWQSAGAWRPRSSSMNGRPA